MNLVVYQMVQLKVMHEADGNAVVEKFACASVAQLHLAVTADGYAFPFFAVVAVFIKLVVNIAL